MKIGDKAEQANSEEVRLANDSIGVYRLESDEVVDAEEIGTEEFPQYGDFIETITTHGGANPSWDETAYVELPGDLARQLTELGIDPGDTFRIQSTRKDGNGSWVYDVIEESPDF
jgi:hypothetical protein